MKKILSILAIILMLAGAGFAQDWTKGSGAQTASALIYTGEGVFHGIVVASDSANAITVSVYDGITATGTKLIPTRVVPTSATNRGETITPPNGPVRFYTGLYVEITCSGTAGYVAYFR